MVGGDQRGASPHAATWLALWWGARTSVAVGWTIVVLVMLWSPPPPPPEVTIPYYDKYFHFTLFLGVGVTWRIAGLTRRVALLAGVALAIVTELVQGVLPWPRTPDVWDVAADVAGLLAALLAAGGVVALLGRAFDAADQGRATEPQPASTAPPPKSPP